MKAYDMSNYRRHLKDLGRIKSHDPYKIETYFKGAFDIAQSFNTGEQAAGVLSKEDMIQECYTALIEAWSRVDWKDVGSSDEPQARVWAFLKKSIKLKARERVHNKKDGIRIPHSKRWNITETKNVDDFLTQLFPPDFFAENDESLGLFDDEYLVRYDVMILGEALNDVMRKYLSEKERFVVGSFFGVDRDKSSTKEISKLMKISVSNVTSTISKSLGKLRNDEVKAYLSQFYEI